MADLDNERLAAETRKFVAEHDKLFAEERKLGAERDKLFQEALKLERERWWYIPVTVLSSNAVAAIIAAIVGVIAARLIH